jgi:hypothetical protein
MCKLGSGYEVVRAAVMASALTLAVASAGCGGNKSKQATSLGDADVGDRVTVAGTLSTRGSTPHTILMLEMADGGVVVIQSSKLQDELRTLSGMNVSIEGKVLPSIDKESPLIDAHSYELLALPSGEVPLVGTVQLREGQCVLETADKKLYWIRGDFAEVLKGYEGSKVWVVGTVGGAALPEKPEGSVPMQVTGYGVLSSPR